MSGLGVYGPIFVRPLGGAFTFDGTSGNSPVQRQVLACPPCAQGPPIERWITQGSGGVGCAACQWSPDRESLRVVPLARVDGWTRRRHGSALADCHRKGQLLSQPGLAPADVSRNLTGLIPKSSWTGHRADAGAVPHPASCWSERPRTAHRHGASADRLVLLALPRFSMTVAAVSGPAVRPLRQTRRGDPHAVPRPAG